MRAHPLSGLIAGLVRLVSGVRVQWKGCEPSPAQRVYYANHTSHLDAVVIWAALPPDLRVLARPVAAADYWSRGARRFFAERIFHAVLIDRKNTSLEAARRSIERLAEEMGDAYSLIIFPEGTRGAGEGVGQFKSGLHALCQKKPGLELVPVYIENMHRVLPKGETMPVPFLSRVIFGPAIRYDEQEKKHEFLDRLREALLSLKPTPGPSGHPLPKREGQELPP